MNNKNNEKKKKPYQEKLGFFWFYIQMLLLIIIVFTLLSIFITNKINSSEIESENKLKEMYQLKLEYCNFKSYRLFLIENRSNNISEICFNDFNDTLKINQSDFEIYLNISESVKE